MAFVFFGRSEVTRTPGILLPKQARYQLRYTPIYSILFVIALCLCFRFVRPGCGCRLPFRFRSFSPTTAPFPPRFFRHRRRSAPKPKAGALPTALHPDIFYFVCDCSLFVLPLCPPWLWLPAPFSLSLILADHCPFSASLLPPPAALGSKAQSKRATICATPR